MPPQNIYLVVEPMPPIAEDLALSLSDGDPGGEVLVAATEAQALQAIQGRGPIVLAIVHNGPQDFLRSELGAALAERGARVVLIGDRAEEAPPHAEFAVLQRPYDADHLMALMAQALQPPDKVSGG